MVWVDWNILAYEEKPYSWFQRRRAVRTVTTYRCQPCIFRYLSYYQRVAYLCLRFGYYRDTPQRYSLFLCLPDSACRHPVAVPYFPFLLPTCRPTMLHGIRFVVLSPAWRVRCCCVGRYTYPPAEQALRSWRTCSVLQPTLLYLLATCCRAPFPPFAARRSYPLRPSAACRYRDVSTL